MEVYYYCKSDGVVEHIPKVVLPFLESYMAKHAGKGSQTDPLPLLDEVEENVFTIIMSFLKKRAVNPASPPDWGFNHIFEIDPDLSLYVRFAARLLHIKDMHDAYERGFQDCVRRATTTREKLELKVKEKANRELYLANVRDDPVEHVGEPSSKKKKEKKEKEKEEEEEKKKQKKEMLAGNGGFKVH